MTRTENLIHEPKLTWEQVNAIRRNYRWHSSTHGCKSLAERYGVSTNTVHKIVRGKTWKPRPGGDDVQPPKLKPNHTRLFSSFAASTESLRTQLAALQDFK